MSWTYDYEADAIAVVLSDLPIARTVEVVPDRLMVDYDAEGRPVCIEILGVGRYEGFHNLAISQNGVFHAR